MLYRLARPIGCNSTELATAFYYKGVCLVAVIAAIVVSTLVCIKEVAIANCIILVIVKVGVFVIVKNIASIAIVIILKAVIFVSFLTRLFILVGLFCFAKRILAGFAFRCIYKLCWSTACIGLEEHNSSNVVSVVFGRKD